jgi:glycosyltransferase involved in cell wall biosynthesis
VQGLQLKSSLTPGVQKDTANSVPSSCSKKEQGAPMDWSKYRVAVVTPYYRIDPEKFHRCCASVAAQTFKCDHILVADGEPQALPDEFDVIHMALPQNIGNSGASPRGFGAQYAFVQGYDAVAFLDADNWFDEDHIEVTVSALEEGQEDVVFSSRHIVFPDGDVLEVDDPTDANGNHVDTSCYVFSKRAAYLMAIWAMYPKEFGAIEDRIMRAVISKKNLKAKFLTKKTMWYETNWPIHYSLAQKQPVAALHKLKNRPDNEDILMFLKTRCGLML